MEGFKVGEIIKRCYSRFGDFLKWFPFVGTTQLFLSVITATSFPPLQLSDPLLSIVRTPAGNGVWLCLPRLFPLDFLPLG
jgi:hypothetical protein